VVLQVHDQWLEDYLKITSDLFRSYGYANAKHDTRVGYIRGGHFHIIIDVEEDTEPKPVDPLQEPIDAGI
jgi:hypothetical protein